MANEAKQFTIGGVTHDVMDVGARQLITQLQAAINAVQTALNNLMNGQSVTDAIDTFNEIVDFLNGIDTDDPTLANQLLALNNAITGLQTALAGKISGIKANGASTTLPVDQNGIVELPPAGSTISPATAAPSMDGTAAVGSSAKYAREDHVHPHDTSKANASDVYPKTQTYNKDELDAMLDDIEAGDTIVVNSDGANIVDEHDNNSVLFAPSARQMKLMYENVMAMYNALANIAFTNGKPTLDWVGAKTKYTLAYGTLNGCTADVAAGQVNEGALRIKLTPAQASYAFTSVTVNGESASTTATGDADGSVYLDIIVNGNITVAATAISGRAVNFNGTGCSIGAAGVAIGQDLDTTITANEHYTLPQSITVKIGNTNVTHTYTKAQDGKTATLHIDAVNITGDLTITCTADEDAHAVLDLTNVGSGVSVNKGNNAHVYVGDTITILPASGNKVTTSATIGGNAATLTGDTYAGYSYTIGSGDVSSTGTAIAITAAASALDTFSIGLTVTSDVGVTWTNPSASAQTILEGSPFKITLAKVSGTGSLQVGTCTMAGGTLTPNNGVIETDHVTGNITIAASVEEVFEPDMVHSWGYESTTDSNNKRYLHDAKGDFWLYNPSDAGLNTQYVPSGCYGNADSSVTNANAGYGSHRTLYGGNNFTIRVKHYEIVQRTDSSAGVNAYLANQKIVKMFSAGDLKYTPGQFKLKLTSSNGSGTTSSSFCIGIDYGYNSSSESVYFNQQMTAVSDNNIHDYFITYDSTTNKASCYRATIDPNGVSATTVVKCGEAEPQTALKFKLVAYKPEESNINGIDIYNYAMTQAQVEALFGITNND